MFSSTIIFILSLFVITGFIDIVVSGVFNNFNNIFGIEVIKDYDDYNSHIYRRCKFKDNLNFNNDDHKVKEDTEVKDCIWIYNSCPEDIKSHIQSFLVVN